MIVRTLLVLAVLACSIAVAVISAIVVVEILDRVWPM